MPTPGHNTATRAKAVTEARRLITDEGLSANKAAEKVAKPLGVTSRSVQSWAQKAGTPLGDHSHEASTRAREIAEAQYQAKRAALRNLLLDKVTDIIGRMDQPQIDFRGKDAAQVTFPIANASDVRNYAVAAAVLIDKMRLEAGEPTSITQATDEMDQEFRRLLSNADDKARART
jgi:hypothetical protein